MRSVKLSVGSKPIGTAVTWAYPGGGSERFIIPTYQLTVSGHDSARKQVDKNYEVIRFGVQQKTKRSSPRVVGLANQQTHVIKAWLPHYTVHSANSPEKGAWQVYDNFLIHDGPDDPHRQVYASIGCVEICGGPAGFDRFNDHLIELSGPKSNKRAEQLVEIGRARNISIKYERAKRPPLVRQS